MTPKCTGAKTGNQWYFGADIESGLVHSVHTTAANEADVSQTEQVLLGEERSVWVDAGSIGADKREGLKDKAIDGNSPGSALRSKKLVAGSELRRVIEEIETLNAKVPSRI